jgi:putative component of toxin-antitoxin plasmid stabilization module
MKYEIKTTNIFDKWLGGLKDKTAVNRIMARIYRMETNPPRKRISKKPKKSWGEK